MGPTMAAHNSITNVCLQSNSFQTGHLYHFSSPVFILGFIVQLCNALSFKSAMTESYSLLRGLPLFSLDFSLHIATVFMILSCSSSLYGPTTAVALLYDHVYCWILVDTVYLVILLQTYPLFPPSYSSHHLPSHLFSITCAVIFTTHDSHLSSVVGYINLA